MFTKLISINSRIVMAVLFMALSACSSTSSVRLYTGPALPLTEEATVILPEAFEILEINGQAVNDMRLKFRTGNLALTIPAGEHTLVFQYKEFWQVDDDSHDTVSSGPITFKTVFSKQETVTFHYPKLSNHNQAEHFSLNPTVYLLTNTGKVAGSHTPKDNALILSTDKNTIVTQYPNLNQLKFWWNRATYYEQSEFLSWQKQQVIQSPITE